MKKKLVALLLALALVFSLLPGTAFASNAAEPDLPDWYFLFAIFKNIDADVSNGTGEVTHVQYSMSQEEVELAREQAKDFEAYMSGVGVMRAHVDVVEIDTTVTDLTVTSDGDSYLAKGNAAPLLETDGVDLDPYDHVTCIINYTIWTVAGGRGGSSYENGTGHSSVNFIHSSNTSYIQGAYIHEFLHFMENMGKKWGAEFNLHSIIEFYGPYNDWSAACLTDIILNQAKGDAEIGTGVVPIAWQYPPHVLRNTKELTIPEGVTAIGDYAFHGLTNLEKVTIPGSVTSIGGVAFYGCSSLKDVYYGGNESQWKQISIDNENNWNSSLLNATIHYNRIAFSDVPANDWYANAVVWAVANGVTDGTGNGMFSPSQTCNQAQILTFLWRAKGEPEPAAAVSSNEYYAKAAQWAKEQGLTDAFSAEAPCTRAMVVTYLWKLAGSPVEGASSFTDVPAGSGYAQAVAWAVKNGVTSGTGNGAFSPDQTCTRSQIVTFLYRQLGA